MSIGISFYASTYNSLRLKIAIFFAEVEMIKKNLRENLDLIKISVKRG